MGYSANRLFQLTRSRGAWHRVLSIFGNSGIFQLTRSRGAWPDFDREPCSYGYFNSHAHVERDRLQDYKLYSRWYFNSHAHVERDMTLPSWQGSSMTFQLTRSRGAWLVGLADEVYKWNFNSHAHVERDAPRRINRRRQVQFQLTRSRGAWQYEMEAFLARYQFQLTRSRGAWLVSAKIIEGHANFNSHAHVERDNHRPIFEDNLSISTHTLTWSVTGLTDTNGNKIFISTHTLTWSVTPTKPLQMPT